MRIIDRLKDVMDGEDYELISVEEFNEKYGELVDELEAEITELAKYGHKHSTFVLDDDLAYELFLYHVREFELYTGLTVFPISHLREVDIYWH